MRVDMADLARGQVRVLEGRPDGDLDAGSVGVEPAPGPRVAARTEAEKLAFLRQAWREGVDSGEAVEVDFTALKKEARARLATAKRES